MAGDISVRCVEEAGGAEPAAEQLAAAGMAVSTAARIDDAVDGLAGVDCVVGGHPLPDGDGLALLERVREREPDLPVVLYTGRGDEELASRAIAAGVTDYVRPSDGRLVEAVQRAVERHRSRRRAERDASRLEELAENTADVLWSFTADWEELLFVNSSYEEIYGQSTAALEADPRSFLDTVHPEDREDVTAAMARVSDGEPVDVEYRVNEAEEYGRWVWVQGHPVVEDGEVVRVVGFCRDVTDRRTYERELERQNDRLDEFASVVSHDLRNPLNTLDASLQLARETGEDEHFDRGQRAVDRMERLIEDLLTLARQGERVTEVGPVALDRTVREAWESVGADGVLLAEVDGTVRADGTRLHQLLENLLDNAVTHGGDGVTVTVGETADGFYVADDGPGVPDSEREAVFDRGYSTTDGGTGFGLRIVQQVAEAHGWTVSLTESEAGGARFEVTGVEFTEEAEESWYRR